MKTGNKNGSRGEKGFTLVEVMVSMVIFAVGAMAIVRLSTMTLKSNADARRIGEASKLARELSEEFDLFRSFNVPAPDVTGVSTCKSGTITLNNSVSTQLVEPLKDPEAYDAGVEDVLCPSEPMFDDLGNVEEVLTAANAEIADDPTADLPPSMDIAELADYCLRNPAGDCASVDAFFEFTAGDGNNAIYWVTWTVRGGYPLRELDNLPPNKQKNSTVKIVVFWIGMDGRFHWVGSTMLVTAKDAKFYF